MNNIEQLNERIAQLTELVKSGSEAIKNMEIALRAAEEERDRLADQRREQEPKFERVKKGEIYFTITGELDVIRSIEGGYTVDNNKYNVNNYFYTQKRAWEVANKINFLLKLERLHDTFCSDYVPNWNDYRETKFSIYYDTYKEKYIIQPYSTMKYETNVYFPSSEIAQQVCDILNRELEE